MNYVVYDDKKNILGTGRDADGALKDAQNFCAEDLGDKYWIQESTLAVVAMVENLGGHYPDWIEQGVDWSIQDGVLRLTSQG